MSFWSICYSNEIESYRIYIYSVFETINFDCIKNILFLGFIQGFFWSSEFLSSSILYFYKYYLFSIFCYNINLSSFDLIVGFDYLVWILLKVLGCNQLSNISNSSFRIIHYSTLIFDMSSRTLTSVLTFGL